MSHLVLARKYRPKKFSHVVGQDSVVTTLKAALMKNRVAHALLFCGGRGTGKTTLARLVAKSLVCLNVVDAEPCGDCPQCQGIDNFSSLDVIEIDGASHTGVDDIRELRDSTRFMPTSAKYKIFIIDEVHMLSINAFNALLKILEEPPAHVMFMFATTEVHKIPKTILSRCQRYDLKRVSTDTIMKALKSISIKEGFSIADEGLALIASLADGGMRDALSMTEQIISNDEAHYSAEKTAQILGVVSHQAIKDVTKHIINGQSSDALLIVADVYEKGFDLCHMMDGIAEHFRLLALCAHVEEQKACKIMPSLDKDTFVFANSQDKGDLKRLFAMALDGVSQVFQAEKPLLALELFILRAALRPALADAVSINYCLNKLDAIMHNRPLPPEPRSMVQSIVQATLPEHVPSKPLARPEPQVKLEHQDKTTPAIKPAAPINREAKSDATALFSSMVALIGKDVPALASHLRLARPTLDATHKTLALIFEHSLHYEAALQSPATKVIQQAIDTILGAGYQLKLELNKAHDPAKKALKTVAEADQEKAALEQKALLDRASHDPLIKKALEIFGGTIAEVIPAHRAE